MDEMIEKKQELYGQDTSGLTFVKAQKSGQESGCVGLAAIEGGVIMRDEQNPERPPLAFTKHELACFLAGAKAGEFDHLV